MTVKELLRGPDPYDSLEQWQAFTGQDLERYTRSGLQVERGRLRWVLLALDDRPQAGNDGRVGWLMERLAQVEARLQ